MLFVREAGRWFRQRPHQQRAAKSRERDRCTIVAPRVARAIWCSTRKPCHIPVHENSRKRRGSRSSDIL